MSNAAEASGLAIGFIVAFVIGVVLGILGCAGTIKFVEWMRGKALFFTPWPRVTQMEPRNTTWQNPTYELDETRDKQNQENSTVPHISGEPEHSSSLLKVLEQGTLNDAKTAVEVYEKVDEPINEEEMAMDFCLPHQALPYAVHDFSDDKPPDAEVTKPVKYKKAPKSTNKGVANDVSKATKNNGVQKPTMKSKMKPQIAQKPTLGSPSHQGAMDNYPGGAYSELDKKQSYASLEPHTGLNTGIREDVMVESYGHLHH